MADAKGGAPQLGPLRLSKSSVGTFLDCRLRWMYQYVLRRPHDRPEPDHSSARRGLAGHAAIAEILRLEHGGGAAPEEEQVVIDHACREHTVDPGDRLAVRLAVHDAISLVRASGGDAIAIERNMRRFLPGPRVTLTGRVDVALRHDPRTVEVIDWTFGRPRFRNADDFRRSPAWALYAQIAWAQFKPRRLRLTEVSLLPVTRTISVEASERGDLAEGCTALDEVRAQMQSAITDGDVTPTAGLHCRHCPYGPACPIVAPLAERVKDAVGSRATG